MADERHPPAPREPYQPPVLRAHKLFVEAAVPGCCKVTNPTCSNAMKTAAARGQGKTNRTSTSS